MSKFHAFAAAVIATITTVGIAQAASIHHATPDHTIREIGSIAAIDCNIIIQKEAPIDTSIAAIQIDRIQSAEVQIGIASVIAGNIHAEAKIDQIA